MHTTITLEDIQAEHARLGHLIAAFTQPAQQTLLIIREGEVMLSAGERYAGLLLADDGTPSHHLVLLPNKPGELNWQAAKDWAASVSGELPTRREQSLLFANLKGEFEPTWHWSSEEHTNGSYAWGQGFYDGYQNYGRKDDELSARAVRRVAA